MMIKQVTALSVASLILQGAVLADGFRLAGQSPEAVGKGNAFVATANTAAAVYYNAAGLSQIDESSVQVGFYAISVDVEARVDGGDFDVDDEVQVVPQIYSAFRLNEKVVLGLGINTPFGLSSDWGDDTSFRTTATRSELEYLTVSAVASYQVNEHLSIGGGVAFNHADIDLRRGIGFLPNDELSFEGDDQAISWTVSVLWQPSEKHSFGAVYRSETDFTLEGTVEAFPFSPRNNGQVDFSTPATFAVGYSYRPNKKWNIEVNVEWTNWDDFGTLTLEQDGGVDDLDIPFEWEDSFIYSIGAEYDMGNGYLVRFGYNFIESAQPDEFYNPAVADADRHWLTAGLGYKGESWSWDAAYQFAFSDRAVDSALDPSVNGRYKTRAHSLSLTVRHDF